MQMRQTCLRLLPLLAEAQCSNLQLSCLTLLLIIPLKKLYPTGRPILKAFCLMVF